MPGDSLFEREIRKLPIPVCKAFLRHGRLAPVQFSSAGQLYCDPAVKQAYPTLKMDVLQVDAAAYVLPPASSTKSRLHAHDNLLSGRRKPLLPCESATFLEARQGSVNEKKKTLSSKRIAVLFSGGPAAGGHNVIVGLKRILEGHTLLGVRGGPAGLLKGDFMEIKDVSAIVNTGGFDYLGTDRTKIKKPEQLEQVRAVCQQHDIDAIIIIGGDDSNTNAAIMAEHVPQVQVVSVPKTMDGDVQVGGLLPAPFGYDTACRIYAEMVGNILQDTPSSRKYWHFIKVMGRTASQVCLEVALQTQPPVTLVSEEALAKNQSIHDVVDAIADAVIDRASRGMNYGVVLIPEGLLEFVPEVSRLILEIDEFFGKEEERILAMDLSRRKEYIAQHITHTVLFASLPSYIQEMLVADRDSHGNLKVAQIPTERLLAELVTQRVKERAPQVRFAAQTQEFGYEGRCGAPTLFDAMFSYNLGLTAGSLVLDGRTGYMAAFTDFTSGGTPLGLPLKCLLTTEEREGLNEYVIKKALVSLDSPAFRYFVEHRAAWARDDCFRSPGPRQLWGPAANQLPKTVALNQRYGSDTFRI